MLCFCLLLVDTTTGSPVAETYMYMQFLWESKSKTGDRASTF